MKCEEYQKQIMALLDGELDAASREALEKHLEQCPICRKEMETFKALNRLTEPLKMKNPEDIFWDGYWNGIYNRLERRTGWILVILGGCIILFGAGFMLFRDILLNPAEPLWIRIGLPMILIGGVFLFSSAVRERIRAYRNERYKDVRR